MDEDELIERLQRRAEDPSKRTDMLKTASRRRVDAAAVADAESRLGFQLPALFVRLLSEVANGGFGPGCGILGLPPEGYADDDLGNDLVGDYLERRDDHENPAWQRPAKVIAICNWGCAVWSYLDCEQTEGRILTSEANESGFVFHETASSLHEWLVKRASGVDLASEMYETVGSRMGINPFTKKPLELPIRRLKGPPVSLDHRK